LRSVFVLSLGVMIEANACMESHLTNGLRTAWVVVYVSLILGLIAGCKRLHARLDDGEFRR